MLESDVIQLVHETLLISMKMSAPILIISMAVGLVISIFQTTTSIQEQTLTFVPKVAAVGIALALFFSYMLTTAMDYTTSLYTLIQKF